MENKLTFGTVIGKNPDEKWYDVYPMSDVDVTLIDKVPFISDKIYRLYKFDFDPEYQEIGKTYVLSKLPIQTLSSYFKNGNDTIVGILNCYNIRAILLDFDKKKTYQINYAYGFDKIYCYYYGYVTVDKKFDDIIKGEYSYLNDYGITNIKQYLSSLYSKHYTFNDKLKLTDDEVSMIETKVLKKVENLKSINLFQG